MFRNAILWNSLFRAGIFLECVIGLHNTALVSISVFQNEVVNLHDWTSRNRCRGDFSSEILSIQVTTVMLQVFM